MLPAVPAAVLYLTLFVCATLIVVLIYRYDLYDKEPWYMMLLAAGLGAVMMWAMRPLEVFSLIALGQYGASDVALAFVAATHEGLGKFTVVLVIAMIFRGVFNDPADGIIYGSLVGLGAAIMESVGVLGLLRGVAVLPPQEVVRLLGHAVFGGITGYGLGALAVGRRNWWLTATAALLVAMGLHFTWDVVALTQERAGSRHGVGGAGIMLLGMLVYGTLVVRAARHSRAHFNPQQQHRLFGWPLSRLLKD